MSKVLTVSSDSNIKLWGEGEANGTLSYSWSF